MQTDNPHQGADPPILSISEIRKYTITDHAVDHHRKSTGVWVRDQITFFQKVGRWTEANAVHYRLWLKRSKQFPSIDLYLKPGQKFIVVKDEWFWIKVHPFLWYVEEMQRTDRPSPSCVIL